MKYLVSAAEMKCYDGNTIEKIGIPACVLMERAALAVAEEAEGCHGTRNGERHALVMAGMGNNGGDGLAAARLLAEKRWHVEVWCVGDRRKASVQWLQQRRILENYPVDFVEAPRRSGYLVLMDALFGVGLSREVSGVFREAVELFNRLEGRKIAFDIPSGVDSDTGRIWGCAVKADITVTFGFWKRGLALYPGCQNAGRVVTADIGISSGSFFGQAPGMYAYDEDPASLMPARRKDGNKGTFGKVLLVAGSRNMAGTAVLAARAAYRAGAGMVKVISPEENRLILQQAVPEALFGTEAELQACMQWADVIALGPGLGKGESALESLRQAVCGSTRPLLADADGLNLLSEQGELREILSAQGSSGRKVVLTPHLGELARLTGKSIGDCQGSLPQTAMELAAAIHGTVAAKDARTFICREGHPICVNLSGNSGMATAGSGDVLTGVVSALLAQGMEDFEAAALGVYLHGRAGDRAAGKTGEHACMAGDVAESLSFGNISEI